MWRGEAGREREFRQEKEVKLNINIRSKMGKKDPSLRIVVPCRTPGWKYFGIKVANNVEVALHSSLGLMTVGFPADRLPAAGIKVNWKG